MRRPDHRDPGPPTPDMAARQRLAGQVARDLGARLGRAALVREAVAAARAQTTFPESVHWRDHSLAQGYAGLSVLSGALDRCLPDEGWDRIGHRQLQAAAGGAERAGRLPASLYAGVAGLGFAGLVLSGGRSRYGRFLGSVDAALLPMVSAGVERLAQSRGGRSVSEFDLISGLAGVGVYLLGRRQQPAVRAALTSLLQSLARLLLDRGSPPGWHTTVELLGRDDQRRQYPYGNLNCGLAHGLPGPLALLAVALREGVEVQGAAEATDRAAGWLADHRLDDDWGVNWPNAVPVAVAGATSPPQPVPSRTAWCYGAPGVARALWLAGEALGEDRYRKLAVTAMEDALSKPQRHRGISSPTFCHGTAGLLQVTLRFARDTGLAAFDRAAGALTDELLSAYEPGSLLGYRTVEPGDQRVDQPGLLDGAPGVALALLAVASPLDPVWDRLFLLS
jgi:lantibiotic biosynthesis protein